MQLHAFIKTGPVILMLLAFLSGCAGLGKPAVEGEAKGAGQSRAATATLKPELQKTFDQAVATLRARQYKLAIRQFASVSKQAPRLAVPYVNQAIAYRQLGDYKSAATATEEALKRDKKSPEALNMLGLLARNTGDFKAAKKSYQQAVSIQPDYAEAHLNLAMLCDIYLVDWPCAKQHYDRFQAIAGKSDKQVRGWVADLDRRMKKAGKR